LPAICRSYVDRILRGEKPGDLPIQTPLKLELVVNLRAAKAMALEIPEEVLTIVDKAIE
jgi:putative ABC transport system substrate-binding protein